MRISEIFVLTEILELTITFAKLTPGFSFSTTITFSSCGFKTEVLKLLNCNKKLFINLENIKKQIITNNIYYNYRYEFWFIIWWSLLNCFIDIFKIITEQFNIVIVEKIFFKKFLIYKSLNKHCLIFIPENNFEQLELKKYSSPLQEPKNHF